MSQYFILIKLHLNHEDFRQYPDIMPRTYPPEHNPLGTQNHLTDFTTSSPEYHPLGTKSHLPDSPISLPLFPHFPTNNHNNLNFKIIGIYSSRARALNFLNRFDSRHWEQFQIFGPFELNSDNFRITTCEEKS